MWVAIPFFQLSILVRETAVIFVGILILLECFQKKSIHSTVLLACSVLPFFAWKGYETWRLFPYYGWSTFLYGPKDFDVPFGGIFNLFITRWNASPFQNGLLFFGVVITVNLVIGILLTIIGKDPFSLSLLLYSVMHVCLNYTMLWSGIRSIERTTYEGFLFLVIAFLARSGGIQRPLRYGILLFFAILGMYDLLISSQAEAYRAGLNLLRPLFSAGTPH